MSVRDGQGIYGEVVNYRLPRGFAEVWRSFFSRKIMSDSDGDRQMYWCLSKGLGSVCITEEEAVALRELLPSVIHGTGWKTRT